MRLEDLPRRRTDGAYTKDDRNILEDGGDWGFNYLSGIGRDENNPLYFENIVIGPGMKVLFGNWEGRKVKPGPYPFYYLDDSDESTT